MSGARTRRGSASGYIYVFEGKAGLSPYFDFTCISACMQDLSVFISPQLPPGGGGLINARKEKCHQLFGAADDVDGNALILPCNMSLQQGPTPAAFIWLILSRPNGTAQDEGGEEQRFLMFSELEVLYGFEEDCYTQPSSTLDALRTFPAEEAVTLPPRLTEEPASIPPPVEPPRPRPRTTTAAAQSPTSSELLRSSSSFEVSASSSSSSRLPTITPTQESVPDSTTFLRRILLLAVILIALLIFAGFLVLIHRGSLCEPTRVNVAV